MVNQMELESVKNKPVMTLPMMDNDDALEIILKLPGESCNLNCTYCYEKRQPTESDGFINSELLSNLFSKISNPSISIGLHGGEPLLLGKDRISEILECISQEKRVKDVRLQTNGTLLNDDWIALFENSPVPVTIGVSHDGPEQLSKYRVSYGGRYKKSASDEALQKLSHAGINFGVICVVSTANVDQPESLVKYFSQFSGVKSVNFVPCFDYSVQSRDIRGLSGDIIVRENSEREGLPKWAITPLQFLNFLEKAWGEWEKTSTFIIEPFVSVIRAIHGKHPESCDFTNNKCAHVFTVYPDGRLTSCDEFESDIADTNFNVKTSLDFNKVNLNNVLTKANRHLEKCTTCRYQETCRGGCIATRERYLGSPYYQQYCEYKASLIDFVSLRTR